MSAASLEAERRLREDAEERLQSAEAEFRRAEADWNALSVQVEAEIESNRAQLEEATGTADRLYVVNRELLDRVELALSERDDAREECEALRQALGVGVPEESSPSDRDSPTSSS